MPTLLFKDDKIASILHFFETTKFIYKLTPEQVLEPRGSGNGLTMHLNSGVHGSISTEEKNSTKEGVEEIVRWQCRDHLRCGPGCYK
jgi:hypothetical protein